MHRPARGRSLHEIEERHRKDLERSDRELEQWNLQQQQRELQQRVLELEQRLRAPQPQPAPPLAVEPVISPPPVAVGKLPPKQAAVMELARRTYPPDGKVPRTVRTAVFQREVVNKDWEVVAKKYDLDPKQKPDWHTVSRAIGREP